MLNNKISAFFSAFILTICLMLTSSADALAQNRQMPPGNSTIPVLSEQKMESLDMDKLDTDLLVRYISTLIFNPSEQIPAKSLEARVANTMVKSLSQTQLDSFSQQSSSKAKACVGDFCTTAQCSDLNYGDFWSSIGLCV